MTRSPAALWFLTLLACFSLPWQVHPGAGQALADDSPLAPAPYGSVDDRAEDMDLQEDLEAGTVGDIVDSDSADDQWVPAVTGGGSDGPGPGLDGDEEPLD